MVLRKREKIESKISVYAYEILSILLKKYELHIREELSEQHKNEVKFYVGEFHLKRENVEKYLTELKNNNIISSFYILDNGEGYVEFEDVITKKTHTNNYKTKKI